MLREPSDRFRKALTTKLSLGAHAPPHILSAPPRAEDASSARRPCAGRDILDAIATFRKPSHYLAPRDCRHSVFVSKVVRRRAQLALVVKPGPAARAGRTRGGPRQHRRPSAARRHGPTAATCFKRSEKSCHVSELAILKAVNRDWAKHTVYPFASDMRPRDVDASPGHERPSHASPRIGRSRGVPWALYPAAGLTYVTYSHQTCYLFTPREVPSWRLSEVLQVPAPAGPF